MGEQTSPSDVSKSNAQDLTTISLRKTTKERLKPHGQKGQTWDSVVLNLVDNVERAIDSVTKNMSMPVFMKTDSEAGEVQVGTVRCSVIAGKPPRIVGDLELFDAYKEAIEKEICSRCEALDILGKL